MKRTRIAEYTVLAALLLAQCTEMPVRFERVDADQMRTLDFMYTNLSDTARGLCEAAPGDTVQLVACFAGTRVSSVRFEVSWSVLLSLYEDTAYNRQALEKEDVVFDKDSAGFTDSTEVVAIRFVIPDTVLLRSPAIDDNLLSLVGPLLGAPVSREDLLAAVDEFARLPADSQAMHPLDPLF